jgi:hypothetical protein
MDASLETPKRGWVLSGWLIFMVVANAWTVFNYIGIINDFVQHSDPRFTGVVQWSFPLLAVLGVVNVGAAIALWTWRPVGLYIFAATSVIALIINLMLNVPIQASLLGLGGLLIVWLLVRSRWQYFH